MYACNLETGRGFFEGVCAPCKMTSSFRDPPHRCANLDYGRYALATQRSGVMHNRGDGFMGTHLCKLGR